MAGAQSPGEARPTVLLVGRGEPMDEALAKAMESHGLDVERTTSDQVVGAARAAAPDLVLLTGDATADDGQKALAQLAASTSTQVIPVALLSGDAALDARVRAFRHGVVAVIPRSASADEIARRVASLARELPERQGEASGEIGEATLDELVALVKRELRTGILSVQVPSASGTGTTEGSGAFRLVLGAGKPVAKAVEEFVAQLRPLVSKAEPLRWELLESPGSRLAMIASEGGRDEGDVAVLTGLRVLLVVLDPVRADALATELRARGATVGVTDASGRGLDRARTLDPEVVVLDAAGIDGRGFEVVRAIRRDARLRWSSMLVAHWEELWPEGATAPDVKRIAGRIAPLVEPDRSLTERARAEASFDTRLELVGPSRLLRAITKGEHTLHVTVRNPRAVVEIDLAQGLVVGAQMHREGAPDAPLEGTVALAGLLALASGRVRIERRDRPSFANIMSPVEEALSAASSEAPPLPASMPPPSLLGALGGGPGAGPPSEPPVPRPAKVPRDAEDEAGPVRRAQVVAVRDASTARTPGDLHWDKAPTAPPPAGTKADAFEEAPTRTHERPLPGRPPPRRRASMRTIAGVGTQRPPPDAVVVTQTTAPAVAHAAHAAAAPSVAHVAHATVPPPSAFAATAPAVAPPPPRPPMVAPPPPPPVATSPSIAVPTSPSIAVPTSPSIAVPTSPSIVVPTSPSIVVPLSPSIAAPPSSPSIAAPPSSPSIAAPAVPRLHDSRSVTLTAATLTPSAPLPAMTADGFVLPEGAPLLGEPTPIVRLEEPIALPQKKLPIVLLAAVFGALVLVLLVVVLLVVIVPRLRATTNVSPPQPIASTPTVVGDAGARAVVVPALPDLGVRVANPFVPAVDAGTHVVVAAVVDAGAPRVVVAAVVDAGAPPSPFVPAPPPAEVDAGVLVVASDDGGDDTELGDDGHDARPANVAAANFLTIRAARLVSDGNLRDAELLYLRALREDSHNPHANAGLAQLHLRRHAARDALHYAEAAVATRPRRSAYRVILGDALALSGKRSEASAQWQEALRLDPHNHDARQRLHRH